MTDIQTETKPSFKWGSAFQVGGFSINSSQFRLRTIARGYFLTKMDKFLGTGQCMMVREFKVVWNQKTTTPCFKLITTAKGVNMDKSYMSDYFENKYTGGDYFPDVDENDTIQHEKNLSCRKASWFKLLYGASSEELFQYLRNSCITIFSTEDRDGSYYFEEEVVALVDRFLDPTYMKEEKNRNTLFEDLYFIEKKIDKLRKKKGAAKRLISKMCSLITLIFTEKPIVCDEVVDFAKEDKSKFSLKEIAKLGYSLCINDIIIMVQTIDSDKAKQQSPTRSSVIDDVANVNVIDEEVDE